MSELVSPVEAEKQPGVAEAPPRSRKWFKEEYKWAGGAHLPLMMHMSRASHFMSQKLEAAIKLSVPQMRILFEALDPKGVSQSFLGKRHNVDPASITRTVQAMERDGLITRQPDAKDNRLMRVFITEKGRALIESIPPQLQQFEKELLEGWSDAEILQFHALLDKLEQRLDINQIIERYNKEREAD